MQIKDEIARIEREKNKLFETLKQIEGKSKLIFGLFACRISYLTGLTYKPFG